MAETGLVKLDDEEIVTPIGNLEVKYFEIQSEMLHEELGRNAADIALWSSYETAAKTLVAQIEQNIIEKKSDLWKIYRRRRDAGEKFIKEDIEQAVEADQEMRVLRRESIDAKFQYDRLVGIRSAFERKGFLIQSKAALRRKEIEIELQRDRAEQAERIMNTKYESGE